VLCELTVAVAVVENPLAGVGREPLLA